jgi:hypothetical protein
LPFIGVGLPRGAAPKRSFMSFVLALTNQTAVKIA